MIFILFIGRNSAICKSGGISTAYSRLLASQPPTKMNETASQKRPYPEKGKPFSAMSIAETESFIKVDFIKVLNNQEADISRFVNIREVPKGLVETIYFESCKAMRVKGYPHCLDRLNSESVNSGYINIFLVNVVHQVQNDYQRDIYIDQEVDVDGNYKHKGLMDYVIFEKRNGKRYLIVIECKKGHVDMAIKQCFISMKRAYDHNNDMRKVYGFATNSTHWKLIMFNGREFKVSDEIRALLPQMYLEDVKQLWMDKCILAVEVIYSCICEQLENN